MDVVRGLGLEVERTKTSVSAEFGTLNSTLFRWAGSHLAVVPTLRFGMLRHTEHPAGLGVNFAKFRGTSADINFKAGKVFFRWHLNLLRNVRLTLDELGFRGSLACRLSSIFGLFPRDIHVHRAPLPPCPHNVRIHPDLVVAVPKGSMGSELQEVNSYMMASWRWSHRYEAVSEAVRYCVQLSRIRRPTGPRFGSWSSSLSVSRRQLKRRFKRSADAQTELMFVELLATQEHEYEALPLYQPFSEADASFYEEKGK
jgi:hypothetical protein